MDAIINMYDQVKSCPGLSGKIIRKVRDLSVVPVTDEFNMVVACDSDGGIGPKKHDFVEVPGEVLGRFAVRVPLMELLSAGAIPVLVVDTLTVEMEPSGRDIIDGIRTELALVGLDPDKVLTGSTEDNVPTVQTGVGIVVIGCVTENDFKPGSSQDGDLVVCVGTPKSAPDDEVDLSDPEIADILCARTLAKLDFVHDILPVGSKGIIHEQSELAESAGLVIQSQPDQGLDIYKSGGPSTCVLASLSEEKLDFLKAAVGQPVYRVGRLTEKE